MHKTQFLSTSIALLAAFAFTQLLGASEAVLTDDTTANRAIPKARYHTKPLLAVTAFQRGVGKLAFLNSSGFFAHQGAITSINLARNSILIGSYVVKR